MKKFLIGLFFSGIATSCLGQTTSYDPQVARHYNLLNDKHFYELTLEDTSGNFFNTGALVGKTVYVDFWFTTCQPCLKEVPDSKVLHEFFRADTNIVFLNICIENTDRKQSWKQMIKEKEIPGIHLFYARNKPQKVNLLREYHIVFPSYLLVNAQTKIIGYDAPRPSEKGWVEWAIAQAKNNVLLSDSYRHYILRSREYNLFLQNNLMQNL